MLYVTFNDYPGGIYDSQVIDVIKYLNGFSSKKIKLIAFISIRNFWNNRRKIKSRYSDSIVIPMFPGVKNWRWNILSFFFLVLLFYRHTAICRGIFAFDIAYFFRRWGGLHKVIIDARGAYKAEFEEYKVIRNSFIIQRIKHLEKLAIEKADYRIAVSQKLVDYWREEYGYNSSRHVVIPCTLSSHFVKTFPNDTWIINRKREAGFAERDVMIVFSGSSAGWQSLKYSDDIMLKLLGRQENLKIVFLGKHDLNNYQVYERFCDRVCQIELDADKVLDYLCIADYGWLVREESLTNRVASPVKFAEYLTAGLKVLISDNLGDDTDFCKQHRCGLVIKPNNELPALGAVGYDEKYRVHQLAMQYFVKEKYKEAYKEILNVIEK